MNHQFYKNYKEYIKIQKSKAQRTTRFTNKREHRRNYIYERMKELNISGKSILCIGARANSELEFFEKRNFKIVDGIDLFSTNKIIECDMSRIYKHPYFKKRKYDIVFSSESLEHCLDLRGFVKGLNKVCRKYFVCMCPAIKVPTMWDCGSFSFMKKSSDPVKYKKYLNKEFSEFRIVINEAHKEGSRLFFILKKKK